MLKVNGHQGVVMTSSRWSTAADLLHGEPACTSDDVRKSNSTMIASDDCISIMIV
jgi:hypothetical protein